MGTDRSSCVPERGIRLSNRGCLFGRAGAVFIEWWCLPGVNSSQRCFSMPFRRQFLYSHIAYSTSIVLLHYIIINIIFKSPFLSFKNVYPHRSFQFRFWLFTRQSTIYYRTSSEGRQLVLGGCVSRPDRATRLILTLQMAVNGTWRLDGNAQRTSRRGRPLQSTIQRLQGHLNECLHGTNVPGHVGGLLLTCKFPKDLQSFASC